MHRDVFFAVFVKGALPLFLDFGTGFYETFMRVMLNWGGVEASQAREHESPSENE
jgi:hypothetical protein